MWKLQNWKKLKWWTHSTVKNENDTTKSSQTILDGGFSKCNGNESVAVDDKTTEAGRLRRPFENTGKISAQFEKIAPF